jgi:hypothetical protein
MGLGFFVGLRAGYLIKMEINRCVLSFWRSGAGVSGEIERVRAEIAIPPSQTAVIPAIPVIFGFVFALRGRSAEGKSVHPVDQGG